MVDATRIDWTTRHHEASSALAPRMCERALHGVRSEHVSKVNQGTAAQTSRAPCAAGKVSDAGQSVCLPCKPGENKLDGGTCVQCEAGTYSPLWARFLSCTECEHGPDDVTRTPRRSASPVAPARTGTRRGRSPLEPVQGTGARTAVWEGTAQHFAPRPHAMQRVSRGQDQ